MKNNKTLVCLILALTMVFLMLSGCGEKTKEPTEPNDSLESSESADTTGDVSYSYYDAFNEYGYFKDIKALDYVEIFNYQAMTIPNDVHVITDESVQSEIDYIMSQNSSNSQIMDRAAVDGDMVNIDYTGSVNGIKFEGGSTNGAGTEVVIGVTEYIEGFLEQIIGHEPGETFDIEVTFPDDYFEESLQGKDAVFETTINFIVDMELTDSYVEQYLYDNYGWTTVAEMKSGLREDMKNYNIQKYIKDYFTTEVTLRSIPDKIIRYQENAMLEWYQGYAEYNGVGIEEVIGSEGYSSIEELIEGYAETNKSSAVNVLVLMAVAEDMGIMLSEDDVAEYFLKYEGTDDYSSYEEQYGLPYVKHNILCQTVMESILANVILL